MGLHLLMSSLLNNKLRTPKKMSRNAVRVGVLPSKLVGLGWGNWVRVHWGVGRLPVAACPA